MRLPIRLRLFLSYLVVLLIGMSLAAALAWTAVERLYLSTQKENLIAQAQLTAAAVQGVNIPVEPVEPYLQTTNLMPGVHTRLLSEGGAVVVSPSMLTGNTPIQVPNAEQAGFVPSDELLKRSEIQEALAGRPAAVERRVTSGGNGRVLYAAAPILGPTGEVTDIIYIATPLPNTGLPSELVYQFAGILILAVTLAAISGSFLARGIARPVEVLDQAALAISKGDLDQAINTNYNTTELERLSQSFNQMTDSLRHSNQVRNAFIADVTHELRTPLTVIKGTIETLEDGAIDDLEGRYPLLTSMHRETDRLVRLVNDLLVLTRADAQALRLNIEKVNLEAIARLRCAHFMPLASQAKVALEVNPSESESHQGVWVLGDADRLAQIVDNLLDNAIRYAPESSIVTITIQGKGDEVLCAIHNPGPGIPPEHLPYIFERFYRVEASRDRGTGGAGLGLAIVQALVSAQGGRITAQSGEQTGTIISFWLPKTTTAIQLPKN
jgi:signal transduction histidine kinase